MSALTILSGAGINIGISNVCPNADQLIDFSYQKISKNVYNRVSPELRAMFSQDSFDYILGGLMTINLAIEKTKEDVKRFDVDPVHFSNLFQQSHLQKSIQTALDQIKNQLKISLGQLIDVVRAFDETIEKMMGKYSSINYYTLNFDSIFDHILYGERYKRGGKITDFWNGAGQINRNADAQLGIFHMHGDLRYKPFKETQYNNPPYTWPVLVVGDQEVKLGIIASNEILKFYATKFKKSFSEKISNGNNNLFIAGFGFREEDNHIIKNLQHSFNEKIFDNIYLYDVDDKLKGKVDNYHFIDAKTTNLKQAIDIVST